MTTYYATDVRFMICLYDKKKICNGLMVKAALVYLLCITVCCNANINVQWDPIIIIQGGVQNTYRLHRNTEYIYNYIATFLFKYIGTTSISWKPTLIVKALQQQRSVREGKTLRYVLVDWIEMQQKKRCLFSGQSCGVYVALQTFSTIHDWTHSQSNNPWYKENR